MIGNNFLNVMRAILLIICAGSVIAAHSTNNDAAFTGWIIASLMTIHSFEFDENN